MTTSAGDGQPAGASTDVAEDRAGLGSLARGGLLSLVGSGVSAVTGVLLVLAVTRTFPKHTAGVFFALTSVFLIAEVLARLGTDTGLVYWISRTRNHPDASRVSALLRAALTPVVGLSVVLGLVLLAVAEPAAHLVTGDRGSDAADALRVLAALLPLAALSDVLVSATRGYGTIRPTVVLDRTGRSLVQLGGVVAAAAAGSLTALTVAWAAPWVLCAGFALWWLQRLRGPAQPDPAQRQPPAWRDFWTFTGPRAVTSVVQLALQRLDVVLLTLLIGPVAAALYTAATRFLVVGQFANQALSSVSEPRMARLLSADDKAGAGTVYKAATGWLVLLCWPLYLLAATYSHRMLALFGHGYEAGADVVLVLAGAMLVASAVGMVDVVLVMGGRPRWNLGNASLALAVNVGIDLLLIPHLGLLGAAVGWAAGILVKNLLPLAQIWRVMGLHPFGRGSRTAIGLALVSFGALPLAVRLLVGDRLDAMALVTLVGVVVYALGCWRWREAMALDALWHQRRRSSGPAVGAPAS